MGQFDMKIAGHVGRVHALFESTRDYCKNYLTEEAPEFSVTVTRGDLAFEQAELLAEAKAEGMKPRKFTDPFLDRAAIQRGFADHLFEKDVLLCHGSTVAVDGRAYLFTAKCGTGKSTHTRLWREVFGCRATMINDDKPFLTIREEGVLISGSPWSGKHGLDTNITVPLRGICILTRGKENRIRPMAPEEALTMLRKQSYRPLDAGKEDRFLQLTEILATTVPLWYLECTKDPEAAEISHSAMTSK